MNINCPVCDKTDVEATKNPVQITVRNEPINVEMDCFHCRACGEVFQIPDINNDVMADAFDAYRKNHHMLQPSEIKDYRARYGLTQTQFADLLGIGTATISRYENGKVPEESHDRLIKLAMEPSCFREIIEKSNGIISDAKKRLILSDMDSSDIGKEEKLKRFVTLNFTTNECSEFTGFKRFDIDQFLNATLFFCKGGCLKTKLNKLLFYADFLHYKLSSTSITGTQYAHIPFGPAPDNYDLYMPTFIRNGYLKTEEIQYTEYSGEQYTSIIEPNLNCFSDPELRDLVTVKDFFKDFGASRISKFSHKEKGYVETEVGKMITYKYARLLSDIH